MLSNQQQGLSISDRAAQSSVAQLSVSCIPPACLLQHCSCFLSVAGIRVSCYSTQGCGCPDLIIQVPNQPAPVSICSEVPWRCSRAKGWSLNCQSHPNIGKGTSSEVALVAELRASESGTEVLESLCRRGERFGVCRKGGDRVALQKEVAFSSAMHTPSLCLCRSCPGQKFPAQRLLCHLDWARKQLSMGALISETSVFGHAPATVPAPKSIMGPS